MLWPASYTRVSSALKRCIGVEAANQEIRWIRETVFRSACPIDAPAVVTAMLKRRVAGEPLQYILGSQPFGGLNIITRSPTLIPRPETEFWAARLSESLKPMSSSPISHLDLCTGTGCIPLLLCHNWPKSSIEALAVDASSHAVALAEENARKAVYSYNALAWDASSALPETRGNTIEILQADIFDPSFPKILSSHRLFPFNLLTCNPPYIPRASWEELPRSVKDHEDPLALIGETPTGTNSLDGLDFYHRIASLLRRPSREPPILAENGVVALEVGVGQAEAVEDILKNTRLFRKAEIWKDQWDVDRVVVGWR